MLTEEKDLDNCAACHFVKGKGSPEIFPELANNSLVTADQTAPLLGVILHGAEVPSTKQRPMHLVMQGYAYRLNDGEVAELATWLRVRRGATTVALSAQPMQPKHAMQARTESQRPAMCGPTAIR